MGFWGIPLSTRGRGFGSEVRMYFGYLFRDDRNRPQLLIGSGLAPRLCRSRGALSSLAV